MWYQYYIGYRVRNYTLVANLQMYDEVNNSSFPSRVVVHMLYMYI